VHKATPIPSLRRARKCDLLGADATSNANRLLQSRQRRSLAIFALLAVRVAREVLVEPEVSRCCAAIVVAHVDCRLTELKLAKLLAYSPLPNQTWTLLFLFQQRT
jgi:hypothetical protein